MAIGRRPSAFEVSGKPLSAPRANPGRSAGRHSHLSNMRILVCGGTGFIGRALVPALALAGHRVRLLLRPGRLTPALPHHTPVEIALGRIEDLQSLRAAARGVDVVVHLATGEHKARMEALYRVDVQGTRNLVQAAEEAGVGKILYLSHLGANAASAFPVLRAKGMAENILRRGRVPWVVVRSAWVYGPQDHFLIPLMRRLRRWPVFPLPGGGETLLQPLWVQDLVALFTLLVEEPETGRTLEVGGPEHLTWKDVFTLASRALGRQPRFLFLPIAHARALATLLAMTTRKALPLLFWLDYMALDRTTQVDTLPRLFGLFPERLRARLSDVRESLANPT